MEILEELNQGQVDQLLIQLQELHDKGDIEDVLSRKHRYRVNLFSQDFKDILINSSIVPHDIPQSDYPSLQSTIELICENMDFLKTTHPNRGLCGIRVKELYDSYLEHPSPPQHFFIVDRDFFPEMNPAGLYYVRDGMHHLVAYGLATKMKNDCFPIIGYYGSNK